jgi:exosortase A
LLQAAALVVLGPKVTAGLVFPLCYMLFLVPFGGEFIPWLQAITARIAVALTQLSGVPATLTGVFIDTPVGRFEVAEACSGVKFLIAMIALGTLVAHMGFRSWKRRALFMAACVVVPVLANGVRAWGTIYIAQSLGVAFAAGFDHIVYGWIFFALVMAAVLGVAWRFFDRPIDDRLVDVAAIEVSATLETLARFEIGGWRALAAMLLATGLAALWGIALVRPLADGLLAAAGLHP